MLGAIGLVPGVGALDDAAGAAVVVVEFFAQALLVPFEDGLASDLGCALKAPAGEVAGGQSPGLVHDVDQHRCTVGVEGALGLGDVVAAQGVVQFLTALGEQLLVGDGDAGATLVIDHDGLEALGAHQRPQPTPAGVAGGPILQVIEAHASHGHFHLAGRADAAHAHFAVFLDQGVGGVVGPFASQVVGRHQASAVLVNLQQVPLAVLGLAFDHDGLDAQPGQHGAELGAGVGFLDGAGEGGFAADRDAG